MWQRDGGRRPEWIETTHGPPVDGGGDRVGVLPPIPTLWTQWLEWTHETTEKTGSGLAAGAGGDLGFPMEYIGFFPTRKEHRLHGPARDPHRAVNRIKLN